MNKKIKIFLFAAFAFMASLFVCSGQVFADGDDATQYSSVMQKANGYWLYDCYTNGDTVKESIQISDFNYVGSIFTKNKGNDRKIRFLGQGSGGKMNETVSCREQMLGFSRFNPKPLVKVAIGGPIGVIINNFTGESSQEIKGGLWTESQYFETDDEKKAALTKLGYQADASSGTSDLINISYNYLYGPQGAPGSGAINQKIISVDLLNKNASYQHFLDYNSKEYVEPYIVDGKSFKLNIKGYDDGGGEDIESKTFKFKNYSSVEELNKAVIEFFKASVPKLLLGACDTTSCSYAVDISYITPQTVGDGQKYYGNAVDGDRRGFWYNVVTINFSNLIQKGEPTTWKMESRDYAAKTAMNNLLGMTIGKQQSAKDKVKFNQYEKVWLYQDVYLKEYYAVQSTCGDNLEALKQSAGSNTYKVITSSSGQTCIIIPTQNAKKKVNGLDSDFYFTTEVGFDEIADGADTSKYDTWDPDKYNDTKDENEKEPIDRNDSEGHDCYSAGLEGQGWIICPTLTNMANAILGLDKMIDGLLTTNTSYYDTSSNTFAAWENFRNITNFLLAIILVVIIFSQLTGYGIDNYGIKKMLPKLVIMTILVNLSFFICQLAIDLSNILGNGLESFFMDTLNGSANSYSPGQVLADLVWVVFGAASATGFIGTTIVGVATVASGGGVAVIISLLLALLVALVSVITFFVMIGARTIIVILFTAISPVAFALYILPNTQKYYKQWWKIFQAALVIYPICGALYGVSYLVSSVSNVSNIGAGEDMNVQTFAMYLVVSIAPFLPYLVLPTLLRGAMNALGVVGGALTTIGNGLRKGISSGNKTLQGTNAYKAGMTNSRTNLNRWNAGLDKNGKQKNIRGFGKFVRGGNSGMAAARSEYLKDKSRLGREESYMGDGFEAALINQEKAADAERVKDFETLVNDKTRNGEDKTALYELLDQYRKDENKAGCVAIAKIAGKRKDTAVDFVDYMRKNAGNFSGNLNKSIAKEMTTGTNSGIYKSSSPLGFGWASAINKGETNPNATSYDDWKKTNAKSVINTFVTDSKELGAMKGSEQAELLGLMGTGVLDTATESKIKTMATELIENRDKTPIDYSKADKIAKLSGQYEYKDGNFTKIGGAATSATAKQQAASGANAQASGAAQPGQVFNVNNDGGAGGPEFDAGAFNRAKDARNTARSAAANAAANSAANNATSNAGAAGASDGPDFDVNAFNRARESRKQNKPQNGPGVM